MQTPAIFAAIALALCAVLGLAAPALADEPLDTCPVCAKFKGLVLDVGAQVSAAQNIPRRVYDLRGAKPRMLSYRGLISELAAQDAVFVGEYHDNPATHKLELDLLTQLDSARSGEVSVAMEMFERDVQPAMDDYLGGKTKEEDFMWATRPWDSYPDAYRPIIEYCKQQGLHVTGSNTPTDLVRRISRQGFEAAMQSYTPTERAFLAAETTSPKDKYWDNFKAQMGQGDAHGGGQPMTEDKIFSFYQAQCMKDDTMGESVARLREAHPDQLVVHYSGSFHVDYKLGTAARFASRRPKDKSVVVVLRPIDSWSNVDPLAEPGVADFVIYVPGPQWGKSNDAARPDSAKDAAAVAEPQAAPAPAAPKAPGK